MKILKKWAWRIFISIKPKFREFFIVLYFLLKHFPKMKKNIKYTKRSLSYLKKHYPKIYYNSKKALWKYSLRQSNPENCKIYLDSYTRQEVQCKQKNISSEIAYNKPILICAVKDDLYRVKLQVKHHKKMGINNFVYIDNSSKDGTYEWLIEQGFDVYRTNENFSAIAKMAWFRQITDKYGYNRWYLIVDSDEMFAYPGMESGNIQSLIRFCEKSKMTHIQSFMVDMYSRNNINRNAPNNFDFENYDIKNENCYFDKDSYKIKKTYKGLEITGGPRARVFSDENITLKPLLTKNSLVYLTKEKIYGMHYSIPYYENFQNPIISVLLHYKFLPKDNEKYALIAKNENYSGGSAEYKQYIKKLQENKELYFYYTGSENLNHSFDLLKINIFDSKYSLKLMSFLNREH